MVIESYFPLHGVRKWYFRHSGIPVSLLKLGMCRHESVVQTLCIDWTDERRGWRSARYVRRHQAVISLYEWKLWARCCCSAFKSDATSWRQPCLEMMGTIRAAASRCFVMPPPPQQCVLTPLFQTTPTSGPNILTALTTHPILKWHLTASSPWWPGRGQPSQRRRTKEPRTCTLHLNDINIDVLPPYLRLVWNPPKSVLVKTNTSWTLHEKTSA